MQQGDEKQDNSKKKRRRSGDTKQSPHTNQEHRQAPTWRGNTLIIEGRPGPPLLKQQRPPPVNARPHIQACHW